MKITLSQTYWVAGALKIECGWTALNDNGNAVTERMKTVLRWSLNSFAYKCCFFLVAGSLLCCGIAHPAKRSCHRVTIASPVIFHLRFFSILDTPLFSVTLSAQLTWLQKIGDLKKIIKENHAFQIHLSHYLISTTRIQVASFKFIQPLNAGEVSGACFSQESWFLSDPSKMDVSKSLVKDGIRNFMVSLLRSNSTFQWLRIS